MEEKLLYEHCGLLQQQISFASSGPQRVDRKQRSFQTRTVAFFSSKKNIINLSIYTTVIFYVASQHKQLTARLPPLGSRVHVSVTPCGFHGQNSVWVGFLRISLVFHYHKFSNFIPPFLHTQLIHFISLATAIVRQAWLPAPLLFNDL